MHQVLSKVVVKPGFWGRLFGYKARRGLITIREIGTYSRQPLYTVLFNDGGFGCYFDDRIELVART